MPSIFDPLAQTYYPNVADPAGIITGFVPTTGVSNVTYTASTVPSTSYNAGEIIRQKQR